MVYTGGTLPCHACLDNLRTPDHGSDQEKNQSLNRHNLRAFFVPGKRYNAGEVPAEQMRGPLSCLLARICERYLRNCADL